MESLEGVLLPWAQGVGRSNRPAPTNGISNLLVCQLTTCLSAVACRRNPARMNGLVSSYVRTVPGQARPAALERQIGNPDSIVNRGVRCSRRNFLGRESLLFSTMGFHEPPY